MPTDNKKLLLETVRASRRKLTPRQRARKPRPVPISHPYAIERQYAKRIYSYVSPLIEAVNKYIDKHGEEMLRGDSGVKVEVAKPTPEQIKNRELNISIGYKSDAVPGTGYRLLVATLAGWVAQYFPEQNKGGSQVYIGVGNEADAVKLFTEAQWAIQMTKALGVTFNTAETWWPDTRTRWADDNYRLIKSFATDYIEKVNYAAEQAILNGTTIETLKKEIQALGDVSGVSKTWSKNKAKLIARDQIGKLNGQINQAQQTEVGVDMYTWLDTGDKRVRGKAGGLYPNAVPSHAIMSGEGGKTYVYRWDDATVYSDDGGKTWKSRTYRMEKRHPGQAVNCRCTAIPYWADVLEEADYGITVA